MPEPTRVLAELLETLQRREIPYCRWAGDDPLTLDLLVERYAAPLVHAVLAGRGFKRVVADAPRAGDGQRYLGFEEDCGRIVQLRLRHWLVVGDDRMVTHRLPWEEQVLATRRLDPAGISVPDPSLELLILLVQVAFQPGLGAAIGHRLGRPWQPPRRLLDLCQAASAEQVGALARRLLNRAAADEVSSLLAGELTFAKLRRFRRRAAPVVAAYRLYRRGGATWRRWWRVLLRPSSRQGWRVRPTGGVAIAFLGSDGSGKSTLLRATSAELSRTLATVPVYFGSGDGPSSLLRWPLVQVEHLVRRRKPASARPWRSQPAESSARRRGGGLWRAARAIWAVTLAHEKVGKLRALTRARNRGCVVLCDRFPQNQIVDFNDGPLLAHWREHPWRLARAVARWEGRPYRWAESIAPDLVVKLLVRPAVAMTRKPDMELPELERRDAAIRALRFPQSTEMVDIDAEQPLAQVVRRVLSCIWNTL